MMTLLKRLLTTFVILFALYLVAVNLALNLPVTRDRLNSLQPEQFSVTWERAWSLYPLRVGLAGLAADGQTPSEQWQVDAGRAAASVSLLPLLKGEIRIHDLDLVDIDLRLRPRSTEDEVHTETVDYYPVIRNRDPSAPAEPAPGETDGTLVLEIDDLHVKGEHEFWVSHVRGRLPGEIRGSFRMDNSLGQLSVAGGALDLALASLQVGPEEPGTEGASVKGEIDIPPFKISETSGLALMRVPELDAEIDLPVEDLDFLAWLAPQLARLELDGQGWLRGRVRLSGGEALAGTDLVVEAHQLEMRFGAYRFGGDGEVELAVDPEDESRADLLVTFDRVSAELASSGADEGSRPVLFSGRGLKASLNVAEKDPTTTSDAEAVADLADELDLAFKLTIPSMEVSDLSVYNRVFPEEWRMRLLGGTGTLSGDLEINADTLLLSFDLASDEADLRMADYHATTDFLLQLRAVFTDAAHSHESATLDLDGTLFRLTDAQLAAISDDDGRAQAWSARFQIDDTDLALPLTPEQAEDGAIPAVARTLSEQGFGALLAKAHGGASATLTVSQLDWIAELLKRPLGLSLEGAGELDAEIVLREGLPVAGSSLRIPREALSVTLLEHQVDGVGEASVTLEGADEKPQARVAIAFEDGRLHRRDEAEPSVGDVRMDTEILVRDPFGDAVTDAASSAALSLAIHSASVYDMSTYNPYLPANSPVSLLGGEARLIGDLNVTPSTAAGELLLTGKGVRLAMADEELAGNLRFELLVRDGSAEDLRFDISGSSLVLDGLRVAGSTTSTTDEDWRARFQLEEAEILWQKPMQLSMKADITVKDTRPFVAVLDNLRDKHDWIGELLTIENLGGDLLLHIDGENAVIDDAMVSSSEIGVHAKGLSSSAGREGMLLVRWHNSSGALELYNDQRAFHIVDAWGRFDGYAPGRTLLPLSTKAGSVPKEGAGVQNAAYEDSAPPALDAVGDQVSDRAASGSGDMPAGDRDGDDVFVDDGF
jgi:hypothetical protein